MDNPNITMEEYIRLEEEKARWRGKVYNWETAKYGKIWYDKDVHDIRSVETEFPAIVFNDELSTEKTLSCEPTGTLVSKNGYDVLDMTPLPPRDQRHLWLRYQVEGYTEEIVEDGIYWGRWTGDIYESRLEEVGDARCSITWRQFILALGLHTAEERVIPDKGDLSDYWIEISSDMDFLRVAPSYTYIKDPVHAEGRKSGAKLSGGHFIRRLAHHFRLVSDDGLRGLSVVTSELPLIDMGKLVKLNIYIEVGDDWAWVAHGAERQPVAASATLRDAEDVPDVDEGAQVVLALVHAPHHHLQLRIRLCPRD
ncbi:hypothetical protein Tco_0824063 [Tanacetum coccineum]|uniref:Uncharacterized protein n=1 Tax=Tanacetum coccineum TaxID=301880 RepID=A0ABQ5APC0_9ASTR